MPLLFAEQSPDLGAFDKMEDAGVNAEGRILKWVQLARTGTFRDMMNRKFTITPAHFADAVANYAAYRQSTGDFKPVNFEHNPARTRDPKAIAAAGWVDRIETRNGGTELWGAVDFNDDTQASINAREWRYPSIEAAISKGGGMQFMGFALTNTPAIDGLKGLFSVGETDTDTTHGGRMAIPVLLLAALGLPENASEERAIEKAKALSDADADATTRIAAAEAQIPGDDKIILAASEHTALLATATELATLKAEVAYGTALAEGRILPAQKEAFLKVFASDPENALAGLPPKGALDHLFTDAGSTGSDVAKPEGGAHMDMAEANAVILAASMAGKSEAEIKATHPAAWSAYVNGGIN